MLQLTEELGNVSKACKIIGYRRFICHEVKRALQAGGVAALVEEKSGSRNPHANRIPEEVEKRILDHSMEFPTTGTSASPTSLASRVCP